MSVLEQSATTGRMLLKHMLLKHLCTRICKDWRRYACEISETEICVLKGGRHAGSAGPNTARNTAST